MSSLKFKRIKLKKQLQAQKFKLNRNQEYSKFNGEMTLIAISEDLKVQKLKQMKSRNKSDILE